jgi:hypothetical protein
MSMGWVLRENLSLLLTMLAVSAPFLIGIGLVYYFRYRAARVERSSASGRPPADLGLKREIAGLRERIQVLEAIVTDRKHELSRRIASL